MILILVLILIPIPSLIPVLTPTLSPLTIHYRIKFLLPLIKTQPLIPPPTVLILLLNRSLMPWLLSLSLSTTEQSLQVSSLFSFTIILIVFSTWFTLLLNYVAASMYCFYWTCVWLIDGWLRVLDQWGVLDQWRVLNYYLLGLLILLCCY